MFGMSRLLRNYYIPVVICLLLLMSVVVVAATESCYRRIGTNTPQQLRPLTMFHGVVVVQRDIGTSGCWTTTTAVKSSSSIIFQLGRGGGIIRFAPPIINPTSKTQPPTTSNHQSSSATDAKEQINAFLTRDSRNTFIARVYAILASQLIVTAISIHLFGTHPKLTTWMRQSQFGPIVPIISLLLSTIAWLTMSLSTYSRRSSPMKWQLLLLFTLGEAISVGFVSSFYQYRSVVMTMIVTAIATMSISIYTAKQQSSKYDLSQFGATLSSAGLMLVLYGIIQIFQSTGILPSGFLPYNEMIYGLVGATIFSGYLAYHTKLITAGKKAKYQMNEKDYVFGAMTLYNDIINFFIYLLKVLGEERER